MPIIKSAKKRAAQAIVRQARNYNVRTAVRKAIRDVNEAARSGDMSGAEKLLPKAFKAIDMAAKKRVLAKNTASRRKALLSRTVAGAGSKKKTETAAPKKTSKKKA